MAIPSVGHLLFLSKNVMLYMMFQVKVAIITTSSRRKWDKLAVDINLGVIAHFGYK